MKKSLQWILIIVLSISMVSVFAITGCKQEAQEEVKEVKEEIAEETSEEKAEEETKEEMQEETPAEPVTLSFYNWYFGLSHNYALAFNEVIDEYEALNPNVTIERLYESPKDFWNKLNTMIAGGTTPDIFLCTPELYSSFIDADEIIPLNDYIDMDDINTNWNDLQSKIIPSLADDGKMYGWINWITVFFPYYNTKILKDAGYDEFPTNLTDFEAMLAKTSGQGNYGLGLYLVPGNWSTSKFPIIQWTQALNGNYSKDGIPTLDAPKVIEAITLIKKWYDLGYLPGELDSSDARKMMASGKLACYLDNTNGFSTLQSLNPDLTEEDITIADWPTDNENLTSVIHVNVISKDCENPQAAADLLSFLNNKENTKKMVSAGGALTARLDVAQDPEYISAIAEVLPGGETLLEMLQSKGLKLMVPEDLMSKNSDEVVKIWWSYTERVIYEDMDVTEAMNAAQEEALEVYEL